MEGSIEDVPGAGRGAGGPVAEVPVRSVHAPVEDYWKIVAESNYEALVACRDRERKLHAELMLEMESNRKLRHRISQILFIITESIDEEVAQVRAAHCAPPP